MAALGGAALLVLGCFAAARADEASKEPATRTAEEMARRVDELLQASWKEAGLTPALDASDAEFARRLWLDLLGDIPRVSQAREFATEVSSEQSSRRRAEAIDRLLESPRHAGHLADVWLRIMLPDREDAGIDARGVEDFRAWLRERFDENIRYDNLVGDLIVAPSVWNPDPRPAVFFTSLDLKPEEIAASTARIFLGVQIQCAQCHDHPWDHWKQEDFWSYAAFFARLRRDERNVMGRNVASLIDAAVGEVTLPDTETVVPPRFLGKRYLGNVPVADTRGTRRQQLAIWLTAPENPYLAKAAVNRVWAHLFGRGLVEPIDDLGPNNPSKHPQLLEELADWFVESGYDLRELFRALTNTRAYQLSSRTTGEEARDAESAERFARMTIKTLTAEQLFACLESATGAPRGEQPAGREAFLMKFRGVGDSPTEFRSGIPQALTLMNGREISAALDLKDAGVLTALEAPFFSDAGRVEALFLATLTRLPSDEEREVFNAYVSSGGATGQRRQATADVLWALLNSAEFALNH